MFNYTPEYVPTVFVLTAVATVGILLLAVRRAKFSVKITAIFLVVILVWAALQAVLSENGFYLSLDTTPPRFPLAIAPTFLAIIALFIFPSSRKVIELLPLQTLTLLHIVRIPVELVLWWLYKSGEVPSGMTFEGANFDIIAGLTAPLVAWLAFRNGKTNKTLLIVWNIVALLLLINIVTLAVLSLPTPFQQFGFEQPNRAVLGLPYVWLPSIIVPIVLFSHLAALWQLLKRKPVLA